MATVKGDVHDIGKNIVGVVLGCNDYEVIDLGVMVPCEKILDDGPRAGGRHDRPVGLITPSLDEMVHVAKEMERAGLRDAAADRRRDDQRQAHGGQDRAGYHEPVVHVKDASRCVGVVDRLNRARADGRSSTARTGPLQEKERESFAKRRTAQARPLRRGPARGGSRSTGRPPSIAAPALPRHARAPRLPARRDRPVHRLVAVLHGLGAEGQVPGDLRRPRSSAPRRARLFDDAERAARADRRARSC